MGGGVVEAEAEGGLVGGELGGGAVEEDVFWEEGFGAEGGEEADEFLVGGGVREAELDFDFHRGGGGAAGAVLVVVVDSWWR